MNKARLLRLATFLDTLPPFKLFMQQWARESIHAIEAYRFMIYNEKYPTSAKAADILADLRKNTEIGDGFTKHDNNIVTMNECRTVACAAGWATTIPEFAAAGFQLFEFDGSISIQYKNKTGKIYLNYEAIREFFDINSKTASYIFSPTHYDVDIIGPELVAARIRGIVDDV